MRLGDTSRPVVSRGCMDRRACRVLTVPVARAVRPASTLGERVSTVSRLWVQGAPPNIDDASSQPSTLGWSTHIEPLSRTATFKHNTRRLPPS
jgi:hypothetical protein